MSEELEGMNPAFIEWANNNGINLEDKEDWEAWAQCWVDGYNNGVEDVKNIIRES